MRLCCVTLNLKGLDYGWFDGRSAALIQELRQYHPDIICFQEATIRLDVPLYNQARTLGEALDLKNSIFCPYGNAVEIVERDQGGIALISRWPISDIRTRKLPPGHLGLLDTRVAIFATISTPTDEVGVVTSHFSWRPEEEEIRLMQMGLLLNEINKTPWIHSNRKFIFLGDFNASPNEPSIQAACERLKDAYYTLHPAEPGYTWSSLNPLTKNWNLPDRRIDYIFSNKDALVKNCEVILNKPAPVFPSDHFGVLAELEL